MKKKLVLFSFVLFVLNSILYSQCYDKQISYLRFDDAAGDSLADIHGRHPGKTFNSPSWVVRANGSALKFNGIDQYASIASHKDFDWGAESSFSIEISFRITNIDSNYKVLIGRDQPGATHWWIGVENATGLPKFFLYNETREGGRGLTGTYSVNQGRWNHIVAVRDAADNSTKLYVDGRLRDSLVYTYTKNFGSDSDINIANLFKDGKNDFLFEGELDEIAIYSRALSASEIKEHSTRFKDGVGYCGSESIEPKITSTPEEDIRFGKKYTYKVEATGLPKPVFHLTKAPAGMLLDSLSGELTWLANEAGIHSVEIKASNSGGSDIQPIMLQVIEPCVSELVTYYSLDEGKGGNLANEVSYHEALLYNSPLWIDGGIGKALNFDGTNQYMRIKSHSDFNWPKNGSFSIELLCKYSAVKTKHQVMMGRDDPNGVHWWLGALSESGKVAFYLFDKGLEAKSYLNNNQWHHLAVVRDGNTNKTSLFVDGVKEDSLVFDYGKDYVSTSDISVASLLIDDLNSFYYQGGLDEIAIYEKALSKAEVVEHFMKFKKGISNCEQLRIKPEINSEPASGTRVSADYKYQIESIGVPLPEYELVKAPKGMNLSAKGLLTWQPEAAGKFDVEIKAANYVGDTTQAFTITVLEPCLDGLISYYKLDEGSGVMPSNEISYHQAEVFAPQWIDGWIGSALNFKNENNILELAHHPDFDWESNDDFSIELLCKANPDDQSLQVMVGRNETGGTHWWLGFKQNSSSISFFISSQEVTGTRNLKDGDWHFISLVRDGANRTTRIYVDGDLDKSYKYTVAIPLSADRGVDVGALFYQDKYDFFYNGGLDEIAIFDRALSAAEVKDHFNLIRYKNSYCGYPLMLPSITNIVVDEEGFEAKK